MGQSASYAESSINRALLRLKTAEREEEDRFLQMCDLRRPPSPNTMIISDSDSFSGDDDDGDPHPRSPTMLSSTKVNRQQQQQNSPGEQLPADFGPLVSLTPSYYTLNELREAVQFLPEALWLSLNRVSLLYMLDTNLDGDFGRTDIARFTDWAIETLPKATSAEQLADVLQAHAALHCWYRCLVAGQNEEAQRRSRTGKYSNSTSSHLLSNRNDDISYMFMQAMWSQTPCNGSSPPPSPDKEIHTLQLPLTKEHKKSAALHFAQWVCRTLRVQERRNISFLAMQRRRQKYLSPNTFGVPEEDGGYTPLGGETAGVGADQGTPLYKEYNTTTTANDVSHTPVEGPHSASPPLMDIITARHQTEDDEDDHIKISTANRYERDSANGEEEEDASFSVELPEAGSHSPSPFRQDEPNKSSVSAVLGNDHRNSGNQNTVNHTNNNSASNPSASNANLVFSADNEMLERILQSTAQDYERQENNGEYGVLSIEDAYLIFAVLENYGMPYWPFCRLLNRADALEVERAVGLTEEEANRRFTCALAVEEGRRMVAINRLRQSSFSTMERTYNNNNNNNTVSSTSGSSSSLLCPPVPQFTVSQPTLLSFVYCFIKSYWDMLENIGFKPSNLKVGAGVTVP